MKNNQTEASLFDIVKIIVSRWYVVVVITVIAAIGAGIYYGGADEVSEAEMLLFDVNYPIRFVSHTRALSPHWHHMQLGRSEVFLGHLAERMRSDGFVDDGVDAESIGRIFRLQDNRGRSGPIIVSVSENTEERATRALELWADVFTRMAPVYRSKELLYGMRQKQLDRLERDRELTEIIAGLRRIASDAEEDAYVQALLRKCVALEAERLSNAFRNQFQEEIEAYLREIAERPDHLMAAPLADEDNETRASARRQVLHGLENMFSDPVASSHPVEAFAKIFSIAMTAFLFSATMTVVFEWFRQGKKQG